MNKPSLSFNPVIIQAKSGDIVAIDLFLINNNSPVASIDAFVSYDKNFLSITNLSSPEIKKTDLFNSVGATVSEPGLLYVYAISSNKAVLKSGSIATLYFQVEKTGTTELKILCDMAKKSSKVIRNESGFPNIIDCQNTRLQTASVNVLNGDNVLGTSDKTTPLPIWALILAMFVGAMLFAAIIYRYKKIILKIKDK